MFSKKDFIARKGDIIDFFTKKGVSQETVSEYCSTSGIPITVTCEFILEEMPEHRDFCINKIEQLNEFYGIVPETCGSCTKKCYEKHCITEDE